MTEPSRAAILAIDPGYARKSKGCACAYVVGADVKRVWFERPANAVRGWPLTPLHYIVWERPEVRVRSNGARPIPAEHLIELAAVGAELAGRYGCAHGLACEAVKPSIWKGSIPKPTHHRNLWCSLDPASREVLGGEATAAEIEAAVERGALDRWGRAGVSYYPRGWDGHNLLDAVALAFAFRSSLL